jgi:hypothetical protein
MRQEVHNVKIMVEGNKIIFESIVEVDIKEWIAEMKVQGFQEEDLREFIQNKRNITEALKIEQ